MQKKIRILIIFYTEKLEDDYNNFKPENIIFKLDKNKNIIDKTYNALKNYGIIIIENALSEEERHKIIQVFDNFDQNKNVINLSGNHKIN